MRGLDRNIRLAVRSAVKLTWITYGVTLLMTFWFWLLNLAEISAVSDAVIAYLDISVIMGVVYLIIYTASNMTTDFQQALACGSTRKCAALGMIAFAGMTALMQMFVNAVLLGLVMVVFPDSVIAPYALLGMFVNYVLAVGLGILAGVMAMRFGKTGYYVALYGMLLVTVVAIAGGYLRNVSSGEIDMSPFLNMLKGTFADMGMVYLIALIVGAVLVALAGSLLVHVTKETEVRV